MTNIKKKKEIVRKLHTLLKRAIFIVIVNNKNITANEMFQIRKNNKLEDIQVCIVRNTLILKAIEGTQFSCIREKLFGSIILMIGFKEHPGISISLLKSLEKKGINIPIISVVFEGKILTNNQIDKFSNIPSYKVSILRLLISIKEFCVGRFVRVLSVLASQRDENF